MSIVKGAEGGKEKSLRLPAVTVRAAGKDSSDGEKTFRFSVFWIPARFKASSIAAVIIFV